MRQLPTTVTRKGRITVPAAIRQALGISEGDKIAITIPDPGTAEARLRRVRSVTELTFGSVPPRQRPEDLKALRRAFEGEVAASGSTTSPATWSEIGFSL